MGKSMGYTRIYAEFKFKFSLQNAFFMFDLFVQQFYV